MNILLFILIPLWISGIAKDALFWVYLWQLKEYRLDRMRAHFELQSSRKLFINSKTLVGAALLLLSILPIWPFLEVLAFLLAIIFYSLKLYRSVMNIQEKELRMPRFTFKAATLLGSFAGIYGILLWIAAHTFPIRGLSLLLFADIALPLVITLLTGILKPLSLLVKKYVVRRAKAKRMALRNLLVIGVTGSYGKTSTKEYLAHLLEKRFRVCKTPANTNTEVGIAHTLLKNVSPEHEIFIVEMGAYRRGEIRAICDIVKPAIGILTGINQQHLSLFGTPQNIQEAKYELIDSLGDKGLAIFNGDNEQCRALFRTCKAPKRLYTSNPLDVTIPRCIFAQKIKYHKKGLTLELQEGRKSVSIQIPLLGKHNASNVLGAICVARALGLTFEEIVRRTATLKAPYRTLELKRGIKNSIIIDDSYAANPDGVLVALDVLKKMEGQKKVLIMNPLVELGGSAEAAHKDIGAKIGDSCTYAILTNSDFFPIMQKAAQEKGMAKNAIFCITDAYLAMRKAQELCDEGDIVLLENRIPEIITKSLILDG